MASEIRLRVLLLVLGIACVPRAAAAQDHQMAGMNMDMSGGWRLMQDGVVFGVFNRQGGVRGSDEFKAPNWWMGMASHAVGSTELTLNGMFSLDPATVGTKGYADIFQVGETLDGRPLIDRQHPHDLFMQLAAVWRIPIGERTGVTFAGGPAGEPALGPVAFMHRASISEYPFAPLSHHTFDSTHVSFGVVTAAVDHGPFVLEASAFNAREPDEHRWDFDFGRLDSVSGRVWYKPNERWEMQISTGHLVHPEALEPGNIQRTTVSAAWFSTHGDDFTALTAGFGVNATDEATRNAAFLEATMHAGRHSIYGRIERLQAETDLLLNDAVPDAHDATRKNGLGALTVGGVRDVVSRNGFQAGVGAAATFYAVADPLKAAYGSHPVSFQIYLRIRPPAGAMGRMWNMRMSQPMTSASMKMPMD